MQDDRPTTTAKSQLNTLLQAMPDCLICIDQHGRIVEFNQAATALLGHLRADAIGKHAADLLLSIEHQRRFRALLNRFLRTGTSPLLAQPIAVGMRRPDDTFVTIQARIGVVDLDPDGPLFVVSLREFDQHHSAEERTRVLYQAVEQSPSTVVITDRDGCIEYVNPKFTKLTGYTREEAIGRNPRLLKSGQMPAEIYHDLWTTLNSGREWCGELLNQKKGGELFWEWASISPLINEAGEVTHYVAVKEDITQRKLAEEETKRYGEQQRILNRILSISLQDASLDDLLQEALDAILSVSWAEEIHRGAIFLRNATQQHLEMRAQRGLSQHVCRQCQVVPLGNCLCGRAAAEDRVVFADCVDHRHDVRYESMEPHGHYCVPIAGKNEAIGVLMVYLPEHHAANDQEVEFLASVAQTLAGVVQRKHTEAAREKLARELADASRESGMAEVATGILHNVGNVLNSVNVSANLLLEHLQDSAEETLSRVAQVICQHEGNLARFFVENPQGQHLPRLLKELAEHFSDRQVNTGQELHALINHIDHIKEIIKMQQAYARASGGKENVNLAELMEDALKMSGASLTRHSVQVVREFKPIPSVLTHKHKIFQVLVNLISNAKHALIESDQVERTLSLKIDTDDLNVIIEVTDNGIGISPENTTKIFRHGFTTRENGHGFGLHSSALVTQEIGGSLSVRSEGRGKGASFIFRLPIKCSTNEATTGRDVPLQGN